MLRLRSRFFIVALILFSGIRASDANTATHDVTTTAGDHHGTTDGAAAGHGATGGHGATAGAEHGTSSAGGGHGPWYQHHYQYAQFESYVVIVLVLLTLMFEFIHHQVHHMAESGQHFGQGHRHQVHHEHIKHASVSLYETLLTVATAELTVLGFLAFLVWAFNQAGLFESLVSAFEGSDGMLLPATATDYLHTVEAVHIDLFLAMIFYYLFLLVAFRAVLQYTSRMTDLNSQILKAYEERRESNQPADKTWEDEWIQSQPRSDQHFYCFRNWFLCSLQEYRGYWDFLDTAMEPIFAMPLFSKLRENRGGDADDMHLLLASWFPFHQYLALNTRAFLNLMIILQPSTWLCIVVIFIIRALLNSALEEDIARWHLPLCWVIASVAAICFPTLLVLNAARQILKKTHKDPLRTLTAGRPFIHRMRPAHVMARVFQICIFFIFYECAAALADKAEWKSDDGFAMPLICTIAAVMLIGGGHFFGLLFVKFCAVVSTGDFVQEKQVNRLVYIMECHAMGRDEFLKTLLNHVVDVDAQVDTEKRASKRGLVGDISDAPGEAAGDEHHEVGGHSAGAQPLSVGHGAAALGPPQNGAAKPAEKPAEVEISSM